MSNAYADYTRAELDSGIQEEAEAMVAKGEAPNVPEATYMLFKQDPDLAEAYAMKSSEPVIRDQPITKSFEQRVEELRPAENFYQYGARAVTARAHMLKREFVNADRSIEDLEYQVLKSDEGSRLYSVMVSAIGTLPASETTKVAKRYGAPATQLDEAQQIADRWIGQFRA